MTRSSLIAEMDVARGTEDYCCTVIRAIAGNILDAREAAGVTREAMAKVLGVTTSTLWRKETGATEFKASELLTIALVCGTDVGRLLAVEPQVATVVVRKCGACSREIPGRFYEFRAVLALHGGATMQAEAGRELLLSGVRRGRRRP